MIRQWTIVEEETGKMADLINQGTDQDLAKHLDLMTSEFLRSVVTHVTRGGDTVFHLAAARERINSIQVMLRNKVDINARDGHGQSPLYSCLLRSSMASARLLVDFGADVHETVCKQSNESLLHRMIKGGRQLAVDMLLEAGASIHMSTKDGDTPLHFTSRYNRSKVAQVLIEMGADINAANINQETPLHVAIANCNQDVAKVLIKNKANLTAKDVYGMTPLHTAVAANAFELVRLMLTTGTTHINSKERLLGRTPILLACSHSNQKMVALLLSHGADANLTTNYRKSVLHVAAGSGKTSILSSLIKQRTNPNALAIKNRTPLHCAAIRGNADIMKMLLKAGANTNMKDIDGNTALHLAAYAGNNRALSFLLQQDAQVNATNMLQQTALHLAFMAGHEKTGKSLIEAGCELEALDIQEHTAQYYLAEFHRKTMESKDESREMKTRTNRLRLLNSNQEQLQDIQEDNIGENEENSMHVYLSEAEGVNDEHEPGAILHNDVSAVPGNEIVINEPLQSELLVLNGVGNHFDETHNDKSDGKEENDEIELNQDINEETLSQVLTISPDAESEKTSKRRSSLHGKKHKKNKSQHKSSKKDKTDKQQIKGKDLSRKTKS